MFFNLPWRLAPLWAVQEIEELLLKETTKHKAGILRGRSFCQVVFLHIVHCEWYFHQEGALDCVRSQQPGCLRPLPSLLSDAWDPVPYLHIQQFYCRWARATRGQPCLSCRVLPIGGYREPRRLVRVRACDFRSGLVLAWLLSCFIKSGLFPQSYDLSAVY